MTRCCIERTCGPSIAERIGVATLPIGHTAVNTSDYAVAECPCCEEYASWVNGELHCIACGCTHVPDRTFWARLGRLRGTRARQLAQRVDAFERVLRGRERAGSA